MSKFYTHVHRHKANILVRGYRDGEPFSEKVRYEPYLFVPTKKNSVYKSLKGSPVEKVQFSSMYEAREFLSKYDNVSGMPVYGLTNFLYAYINDEYNDVIDYEVDMIRVGVIDIEVGVDETSGFPNVMKPAQMVTAITIYHRDMFYVFGMGEYTPTDKNIIYKRYETEQAMLTGFVSLWRALDLDIVTGWNISGFDIPYLVNRIRLLLGHGMANQLSPWGIIEERTFELFGKEQTSYELVGMSVLDYLDLYKKFSYTPQESYRLDYIANYELGVGKLSYDEYDGLFDLYRKNFQKFIEYNVIDVLRVKQLDDKLQFIEMVMATAYDGRVNFIDTFTSVKMWDVIIHNYLLRHNIVVDPHEHKERDRQIAGGHVKDPQIGMHHWVMVFDLKSLYPHLMMQYNIGPDTFHGYITDTSVEKILGGQISQDTELREFLIHENLAMCASGFAFKKDTKSFLNALMESMYNDRAEYKKKMLDGKKELERLKACNASPEEIVKIENHISKYKNFQLVKKIQLNSVYGALGNPGFRWYDPRYAESITLSGQLAIRWVEKKINEYLNKILETNGVDYVIAIDTDSIHVNFAPLVEKAGKKSWTTVETVKWLDKIGSTVIQPLLDTWYQELADMMNAYAQKMDMKREAIANKGIWTGKKHYILNVYDNEGVTYHEPQLKIMGIEAVRSSTPSSCRSNIKDALDVIMNKGKEETFQFIDGFHDKFLKLPFDEVAFPRSVSEIDKWRDNSDGYTKGTPIHVKAALNYNKMLTRLGLENRHRRIEQGTKIKFVYLQMPNPTHDTVIAAPDSLPDKMGIDQYIDREKQFQKAFIEPLRTILDAIGWDIEKKATLDDFFT